MSEERARERLEAARAEWEKYSPAILALMDRIDKLERRAKG